MGEIKTYKDLEIWQLSVSLTTKIYKLSKTFPQDEKFGLTAQIRDAIVSVAANIAEAQGRFHYKDRMNFVFNARGSLLEVESHLLVSHALGFITPKNLPFYNEILQDIINLSVKINNFRNSIAKQLNYNK